MTIKGLAEIIRANPGCVAIVDNDCWTIYSAKYHSATKDEAEAEAYYDADEEFDTTQELATHSELDSNPDCGFGAGACYGGDVVQALALIAGIHVESV